MYIAIVWTFGGRALVAKYVAWADGICQEFFDSVDNQLWQSTKGKEECGDSWQVAASRGKMRICLQRGAIESQGKSTSTTTQRQSLSQVSTQAMVFHGCLTGTVRDLRCKCEAPVPMRLIATAARYLC